MKRKRDAITICLSLSLWLAGLFAVLPVAAQSAGGDDEATSRAVFGEMRAFFEEYGSRAPGSRGNLALAAAVEQRFSEAGFASGAVSFNAPVLVPGHANLELADGRSVRVEAMHPTLMRPGNFAESEFSAKLVYLGKGGHDDLERLKGVPLAGAIAVMDFDCGDRWLRFLRFGVKGFVFIGAKRYYYRDSYEKVYNSEVNVPRFFAGAGDGARLRQAATGAAVKVRAVPSRWRTAVLRNPWVLIPGADRELSEEVVVFTAALDANSIVPSLATGGESAGNLFVLMKLLEEFCRQAPARTVMLAAVNAHTQKFLGERMLAWHLLARSASVEGRRNAIANDMRVNALYADKYSLLKLAPFDPSETRLHVMMEVLGELDRRQQKVREQQREEALDELESQIEERQKAGLETTDLEELPIPVIDPVLDLTGFEPAYYHEAIDAVDAAMEAERGGLLSRISSDREAVDSLVADRKQVMALKQLPAAELVALANKVKTVFDDEKNLEEWRIKLDRSTGKRLPIKGPLRDEAKRRVNQLKLDIMESSRGDEASAAEREQRVAEMKARKEDLVQVLVLFNKIDVGIGRSRTRYRSLAAHPVQREMLEQYRDRLVGKYGRWRQLQLESLERDTANDSVRQALGQRRVSLVISLEANWTGEKVGFCSLGRPVKNAWQGGFGKVSSKVASELNGEQDAGEAPFANTMTNVGGLPEEHYFEWRESAATYFHATGGTPALALRTVFAGPGRAFSPDDSLDHLEPARVARLVQWLPRYFRALLANKEATAPANLERVKLTSGARLWSTCLSTFKVDELDAKTTPSQEVPGCLTPVYSTLPKAKVQPFLVAGDVVNCYAGISDQAGQVVVYALNNDEIMEPLAYQMDADFARVVHAMDKGRIQESKQNITNLNRSAKMTLPMFKCREFPIYDRVDPTLLSGGARPLLVHGLWPISAAMMSDPAKFGVHGAVNRSAIPGVHTSGGPGAVYLVQKEKGFANEGLILLTNGKRSVVNATVEKPEGTGYADAAELGPDFFARAASDMDKMNRGRLAKMRGVTNALIEDFMGQGESSLEEMAATKAASDHTGFLRAAYAALGNQVKTYGQMRAITDDMLKAIICYMALMVPFCFFLQKLLFRLVKMEHQMLCFIGLFVGTYICFRFIHPAFAIAMNPEAIFIAFLLGAVGCFITWVMHSRFEGEMQVLFQSYTGMEAEVAYSTVGQTAMIIGVNNMKRRRLRTALTTATIVLVTFTMLAFSSVSKRLNPTVVNRPGVSAYGGFFYHWPGGREMDEETLEVLTNMFADKADVIVRRIRRPAATAGGEAVTWRLDKPGEVAASIQLNGLMGLPPEDSEFLAPFPLVHGRYFAGPTAREALLTIGAAEALDIGPAQVGEVKVRLFGEELTVVGLVDDDRYRMMRDLDPYLPLLPLRKASSQDQGSVDDPDAEARGGVIPVDTATVVFLPEGLAASVGARPFSISIRFPEDAEGNVKVDLWQQMTMLLTISQARFHLGSRTGFASGDKGREVQAGVYYVSSNFRTSVGGLAKLFIPLVIAGTIILNTMLGSVYERKYEIAIYNAIGLNPTHIFTFFLAEAFVYSVIGSVGGYLIGQVLAIAIRGLNVVQDININFSSLMVVYVILFTIGLVLLSTVYPAIVATRTAVPSGQRKWSMPEHDGEHMNVVFPFIYQAAVIGGVMAYLSEYFGAFTEKSLGDQIATLEEQSLALDAEGRPTYSLVYAVALAPYDLGVTQAVAFRGCYDEAVQCFRVQMQITRRSGQDTNWVTTNKPFLEKLRKLLIRWRNLDPAQHAIYTQQSTKLFAASDAQK